jgi:NADPH-dependent curcumin reductase CurA
LPPDRKVSPGWPTSALRKPRSRCQARGRSYAGRIRYREDFVDGLERAPEAFIGMLEGRNFGKLIVRVDS